MVAYEVTLLGKTQEILRAAHQPNDQALDVMASLAWHLLPDGSGLFQQTEEASLTLRETEHGEPKAELVDKSGNVTVINLAHDLRPTVRTSPEHSFITVQLTTLALRLAQHAQ